VNNMEEAVELGKFIKGEKPLSEFYEQFTGRYSDGFDAAKDLQRIGVVNQTTMLASDTQAIADYLKQVMATTYQLDENNIGERFADTRDTLCYATNDNQTAVYGMLQTPADIAIVVGGYNSSNTSHLVELCEEKLPTYYINSAEKIISAEHISHYNFHAKQELVTSNYLPATSPIKILITSGASCPDAIVEDVIERLVAITGAEKNIAAILEEFAA
jgi:4-hydroxy-3-methylbut-2-en-1-yl diphosphate reductase